MANLSTILFFGSFKEYSQIVLREICSKYAVIGVVTTPPAPAGRHLQLTPTPVQLYAESQHLPVFTSLENLPSVDFIICAGYGKLIPEPILKLAKIQAINMHPSLMPKYPGRCPAEWAILKGETETGVSLLAMTNKFDQGAILAQEKIPISDTDTRLTLYAKLYQLGAEMIIKFINNPVTPITKLTANIPQFYARQIIKQDGFVEYSQINSSETKLKMRAFAGWPGVWTIDPSGNRIILKNS